jgi:hypothetical protein
MTFTCNVFALQCSYGALYQALYQALNKRTVSDLPTSAE